MRLFKCMTWITLCAVPAICASITSENDRNIDINESDKFGAALSAGNVTITEMSRAGFGAGGHQGHAGGGKMKKKDDGLMSKILPFLVIPFMISSMMTPMMLVSLKFMLLKSAFVGKIAIILMLVNMFWRFNNQGGLYSHNINLESPIQKDMAMAHYGYNGDEEYGAYINRRRRRR